MHANQPRYDINELQQRRQVCGDSPPAALPTGGDAAGSEIPTWGSESSRNNLQAGHSKMFY
jgi:hypothetical protein